MTRKRVLLHVGLTKTGTTYLQGALRANADAIRSSGVLYAGGSGLPPQSLAVWDLQGRRARGVADHRVAGQWKAMADQWLQ